MLIFQEIPKHRKKKKSHISKSTKKSSHKHNYVDCLFEEDDKNCFLGQYCSVCGKKGPNMRIFETEPMPDRPWIGRMLTNEEVKEKYKHLPVVRIKTAWVDYITFEGVNIETEKDLID